jgi:hypothetical protein
VPLANIQEPPPFCYIMFHLFICQGCSGWRFMLDSIKRKWNNVNNESMRIWLYVVVVWVTALWWNVGRDYVVTKQTPIGTFTCVKDKISLWLSDKVPRHEEVWGCGCIDRVFLTSALIGGEGSASRRGRFTPGAYWVGDQRGSRTGLDDVERRKPLRPSRLEIQPLFIDM